MGVIKPKIPPQVAEVQKRLVETQQLKTFGPLYHCIQQTAVHCMADFEAE